jgi:hypothetical protein
LRSIGLESGRIVTTTSNGTWLSVIVTLADVGQGPVLTLIDLA